MHDAKFYFLFVLLGMASLTSCVKDPQDIPSGITEDPVFGLSGSFGSEKLTIEVGKDGWTMLPVVRHLDSLTAYEAVFSKDGCLPTCSSSWTFTIYSPSSGGIDPSQAFLETMRQGEKAFIPSDAERHRYAVTLTTHPGLFMSGFTYWEDINGSSTTYFHEFQSQVGYQEDLYVCLQSLAFTGCQYNQCLYFDPSTEVPCIAYIEPILENPRFLSLNVKPSGTPPFTFMWANEASSSGIVIPLQDSVATVFAAVTVMDALGNRSELNQTIKVNNGSVDACYFPVSLSSTLVEDSSVMLLADRVEIVYRDAEGQVWRTSAGVQPHAPIWQIISVESFGEAPGMVTAYLVEARTQVSLFNETTGESRILDTERLSLSLGHD